LELIDSLIIAEKATVVFSHTDCNLYHYTENLGYHMFACENKLKSAIEVELDLSRTNYQLISEKDPHIRKVVAPRSFLVLGHLRKETGESLDEERLEIDFKHRRLRSIA
jgi:hypothetical protein